MKKFKGTKFAHIGTSYSPLWDAEIAKVENAVLNQQSRLYKMQLKVKNLFNKN